MPLFHVANDGKVLTMMSMNSGYLLERIVDEIPLNVQSHLVNRHGMKSMRKPYWTKAALELSTSDPVYLWFLFERSEDLRAQEEEPAVTSAMERYAEAVCTPGNVYSEHYHEGH